MFLTDAAWPNAAGAAISGEEPWKRGWGRRRLGMTEAPQTPCLRVEPSFTAVLGGPQSSVCFRRTLTTADETDWGEASLLGSPSRVLRSHSPNPPAQPCASLGRRQAYEAAHAHAGRVAAEDQPLS